MPKVKDFYFTSYTHFRSFWMMRGTCPTLLFDIKMKLADNQSK
jgi:hypothetical protein